MKVVFVGIGAIGLPMARRVAATHCVVGVDPLPEVRAKAVAAGMTAAASFDETQGAEFVVVMVATPQQLKTVVDGALGKVAGQQWVIMSTVGPASAETEGARLREAGATVVDAPVTGGTARAQTGDLVIFAAGRAEDVDGARSVLDPMGKVRVVGDHLGQGQSVKVINQHLCAVHLAAAGEALSLAEKLGLDKAAVLDLVKAGAGGSWMLSDRGPRMLLGTDAPVTSTVNIFVKDSSLVAGAARSCGASVPLLEVAKSRFEAAAATGLGARDDSRIIETYASK